MNFSKAFIGTKIESFFSGGAVKDSSLPGSRVEATKRLVWGEDDSQRIFRIDLVSKPAITVQIKIITPEYMIVVGDDGVIETLNPEHIVKFREVTGQPGYDMKSPLQRQKESDEASSRMPGKFIPAETGGYLAGIGDPAGLPGRVPNVLTTDRE